MSSSPDLHSRFMEYLVACNRPRMDGFKEWIFHPGMLFRASVTWWGDQGPRPALHEGLDLLRFADAGGMTKSVDQQTQIPAAFAGKVVKIQRDFLGQSIYMSHAILAPGGRQLISAFGHTVPRESLAMGSQVAAGEIIAAISGFSGKHSDLSPHLHLTFAWVPVDVTPAQLTWKNLGNDPGIILIDPLAVILPRR